MLRTLTALGKYAWNCNTCAIFFVFVTYFNIAPLIPCFGIKNKRDAHVFSLIAKSLDYIVFATTVISVSVEDSKQHCISEWEKAALLFPSPLLN